VNERNQIDNVNGQMWLVGSKNSQHGGIVVGDKQSVVDVAREAGADFEVQYTPSGYVYETEEGKRAFRIPRYEDGVYQNEPLDVYIVRNDTGDIVGSHSGKYPKRDGYRHVFNTLEDLFPQTCESITVYGNGEQVVVEQCLGEPKDLGISLRGHGFGTETLQPYVYTRMSLNGKWRTEIIPMHKRAACENMLGSDASVVAVRATRNHDSILSMRSEILNETIKDGERLAIKAQEMSETLMTHKEFSDMINNLLPYPKDPDTSQRALNKISNTRGAVLNRWAEELGMDPLTRGTHWVAWNCFQGAEQHRVNHNFNNRVKDQERGLSKMLDQTTPLADQAEEYLRTLTSATI